MSDNGQSGVSGGEQPADRRTFFRYGFSKLMLGLSDIFGKARGRRVLRSVLRPPGALGEKDLLETCYRCGSCVDACGVKAIRPLQAGDDDTTGTPYIDADLQACVVCAPLACMNACPSGALVPVEREQIRMGLAEWSERYCLRTGGQACRLCVDQCPIGSSAIRLTEAGKVEIVASGCVGCGVCRYLCPARPKAVSISVL